MDKNIKDEFKVVEADEKLTIDDRIAIKELEEKLEKMAEDKENKCVAAKEQLISSLEITKAKYLTATGTAEALRILRFVIGESLAMEINLLSKANELAKLMACNVDVMIEKANSLDYEKMDELCEDCYESEFSFNGTSDLEAQSMMLAIEMMRIDLCRNVGGAAEDMVSFINRVDEEIKATEESLAELKANKKED